MCFLPLLLRSQSPFGLGPGRATTSCARRASSRTSTLVRNRTVRYVVLFVLAVIFPFSSIKLLVHSCLFPVPTPCSSRLERKRRAKHTARGDNRAGGGSEGRTRKLMG